MKKINFIFIISFFFLMIFCEEFIDIKDLKIGMKGYCKTVFHKTEIDSFGVEIIDIAKDSSMEMIMVKCFGEKIEKTGIAQGMSGSPVYFDGKLAGSLSYTWDNLKEPVGGVTPIHKILQLKNYQDLKKETKYYLKEISLPLMVSGINEDMIEFGNSLKIFPQNSIITTATNLEIKDEKKSELSAGKAIAIKLVDGDFNISAIGTVTYVDKENVYSLGHPFTLKGKVNYPISEAYIYTVLPKNDLSFKMGFPLEENVGVATEDRTYGVLANLKKEFDMIKVKIFMDENVYNFSVVNDKDIVSSYLPFLFLSAISKNYKTSGNLSVKYYFDFKFTQKKDIVYENMFSGSEIMLPLFFDLTNIIRNYILNVSKDLKLDSVIVKTDINEEDLNFSIIDIKTDKKYYFPGEEIKLKVILAGKNEKVIIHELGLKLPDNFKEDSITLRVFGGANNFIPLMFDQDEFLSFEKLKLSFETIKRKNSLNVEILSFNKGFMNNEFEFKNYPETFVKEQIKMGKTSLDENVVSEKIFFTDFVVNGDKSIVLKLWR